MPSLSLRSSQLSSTPLALVNFNFWSLALKSNHTLQTNPLRHLPKNLVALSTTTFNARILGNMGYALGAIAAAGITLTVLRRKELWRYGVLFLGYALFQTLLMTRISGKVHSSYYYASVLPVLLIFLILPLLPKRIVAARIVISFLCVLGLSNFFILNKDWKDRHSNGFVRYCPNKNIVGRMLVDATMGRQLITKNSHLYWRRVSPESCWVWVESRTHKSVDRL